MFMWRYRYLIVQLWYQEVRTLYRGALLGFFWTILTPFLDFVIYSWVFSVLFHARVKPPRGVNISLPFGLILLAGLFPYNIFAQVVGAAPMEILKRPNYVKKIRFPLEVLPVVRLGVAFFQGSVALGVLLVGALYFMHRLPWTVLLLPAALLPLVFLSLGLGWFFSALGVYLRDLPNIVAVVLRVCFFATPIVYSPSRLPNWALPVIQANPLTFVVQAVRDVLLWGRIPSLRGWVFWTLFTAGVALLGYWWFKQTAQGFADVM